MSSRTVNGIPIEAIVKTYPMDPALVERVAFRKVKGPDIAIVEPDPLWPDYFQKFKARILAAFDQPSLAEDEAISQDDAPDKVTILAINHVGSTSVPTLPAKPVIDIDLVLSSNALSSEPFYVPRLEAAGFQFLLREAWHDHRFFVAHEPMSCNLHVFGPRCPEVERHIIFRDWLREHADDRELYAKTKRESAEAARKAGEDMMAYSARKESVIEEIRLRAFRALGYVSE